MKFFFVCNLTSYFLRARNTTIIGTFSYIKISSRQTGQLFPKFIFSNLVKIENIWQTCFYLTVLPYQGNTFDSSVISFSFPNLLFGTTFFGKPPKMASRIAKTPLVQFQRQLAAQAAPAATIKKAAASEGIEVRVTYVIHSTIELQR